MNRAITIIDRSLDGMLQRPGMWVGGTTPECHHCFVTLVINLLHVRAEILESDYNWGMISRRLLVEMTGSGSGNLGPNSRLRDYYGEASFSPDDPNYGNVMLFWCEFVTRSRDAMDPQKQSQS